MRNTVSYEKLSLAVVDHFIVVNFATGALVTGEVQGDFSIILYNPSGAEVSGSVAVTIAELGSSGNYKATFTPDAVGEWELEVTHSTHFTWGKGATFLVYETLLGASEDASAVRYFKAYDSSGAKVSGEEQGDFGIALYNPSDAEVSGSIPVTIAELDSSGIYKASFTTNAEGKWLLEVKHATYFAIGKRWTCRFYDATVTVPSAPTLNTVVDDETGTSVTTDVTANDVDNLIHIFYRKSTDLAWTQFGSTRIGSGELQVTGLGLFLYEFMAFEQSHLTGEWSLPSDSIFRVVSTGTGTETPSGGPSLVMSRLATLLANSGTFQAVVEAGDATEALDSIHWPAVEGASWDIPAALIGFDDAWREGIIAAGSGFLYGESGELWLELTFPIPSAYRAAGQEQNAWLWFTNRVGAILGEMQALSGTGTYLIVQEFSYQSGPERSSNDRETQGDYWYGATMNVRWGLE